MNRWSVWTGGLPGQVFSVTTSQALSPRMSCSLLFYAVRNLTGNPLTCDCHMLWLLLWHREAVERELLGSCSSPPSLHNTPLRDLTEVDLQCSGKREGLKMEHWYILIEPWRFGTHTYYTICRVWFEQLAVSSWLWLCVVHYK